MDKGTMQEQLLQRMKDSGALLSGHFKLSSGLHSGDYLQCALLLRHPKNAAFAGEQLAKWLAHLKPEVVVSPALGGLIIGHEVARALDVPFLFCERKEGQMQLRRFPHPGKVRFVLIEDVITTGKSTLETILPLVSGGADCVGVGCVADRTAGKHTLPTQLTSLIELNFKTYLPEECPLCKEGVELYQPGSRNS